MKKYFHKVIAICMAFVVLTTTMSFTVDMHYCGDTMVDFAILKNAASCGMEKADVVSSCENPSLSQESCCSDVQMVFEGQDNLKDALKSFTVEQQNFMAAFVYSYIRLYEEASTNHIPYVDYSPPFLERDVQVLHQTFLI